MTCNNRSASLSPPQWWWKRIRRRLLLLRILLRMVNSVSLQFDLDICFLFPFIKSCSALHFLSFHALSWSFLTGASLILARAKRFVLLTSRELFACPESPELTQTPLYCFPAKTETCVVSVARPVTRRRLSCSDGIWWCCSLEIFLYKNKTESTASDNFETKQR